MPENNKKEVFICEECWALFKDKPKDETKTSQWGHECRAKKFRMDVRCESYLTKYVKAEE